MQEAAFKKWLVGSKRYSRRAISDKMSRCRRLEKLLGINLDGARKLETYDKYMRLIDNKLASKVKRGINRMYYLANLKSALRFYRQFILKPKRT